MGGGETLVGTTPWISPVCAETAAPEPEAFDAVTRMRIVAPTSAEPSVYDWFVPAAMSLHVSPLWSHRRHWYVYEIGCAPDHVPGSAVSVCPSWRVPEMVGAAVLTGASAEVTTAVCAESTLLDPTLCDAVTVTRIVEPRSLTVSVYVWAVAPPIATQDAPVLSQRRHW